MVSALGTRIGSPSRNKPAKFFEVVNKTLNIKSTNVTYNLLDTNFNTNERYGTIAPSTNTDTGSTNTILRIKDSFGAKFPGDEKRKWKDFIGLPITVHSEDFTFSEDVTLNGFDPADGNNMLISAISVPPPADYVIDLPVYDTTNPNTNRLHHLFHVFLSPRVDVVSGASDTVFDVGGGDIGKFFVGGTVEVHSADFSTRSGEVIIDDITGTTITVATALGFTPSGTDEVDFIGFPDESEAYRIV